MLRRALITVLASTLLLAGCSGESTQPPAAATPEPAPAPLDAAAIVASSIDAMGMEFFTSVNYSGEAWRVRNSFRQTRTASPPWPERDTISNYQRAIDLRNVGSPVSRASGDTFASNLFLDPPVAGTYTQNVAADQRAWNQQLEVWLTPWGFLKGAQQYGATAAEQMLDGAAVTALTWQSPETQTSPGGLRYTVTGYIGADNLVSRVETWVEDAFMGDMHVVALFSDYRDMNGLMVPATMEQQRGGGGIFGVSVNNAAMNPVNINELVAIPPPAAAPGGGGGGGAPAAPPALADITQQLAENVYLISGGYQAVAIGFSDYVAVFEAGQSEARGQQILDATKAVFPGKQIRYIVLSHPHADHTAGLIPFVREGATVLTHENNIEFLTMALSTPRTLLGEATLSPRFRPAEDVTVLEDDAMRLELHHIDNLHTDGMIVGLIPSARALFQADFTLPVNGAAANPFVVNLAEYVDANGLDFDHYIAVHAAATPQTKADLLATIGK